jgi:hypothetical protein
MRVLIAAGLLAAAAGAGGCYASAGYSSGYSTGYVAPAPAYATTTTVSVDTYQPDLVDVGGGVQVIADYDEPVFYTDNFYWRFYGGTWYRSNVYNSGWTVYNDVPYSVRRIDRPTAYVRYRPAGYTPRARREPYGRDNRGYERRGYERPAPAPVVRDHRTDDRGYERRGYERPAPAPVVRDHRTNDRGYERPAPAPAPVVRDHRSGTPAPAPAGDYRSAPAPATRDHRDNRRDDRRDDRRDSAPVTRDHRR